MLLTREPLTWRGHSERIVASNLGRGAEPRIACLVAYRTQSHWTGLTLRVCLSCVVEEKRAKKINQFAHLNQASVPVAFRQMPLCEKFLILHVFVHVCRE
jgi:hypothetical protein